MCCILAMFVSIWMNNIYMYIHIYLLHPLSIPRYKMLSEFTWPNFDGSEQEGCQILVREQNLGHDVAYGTSKLFIRTPKTLFTLEEARTRLIPPIVVFLQKVTTYLLRVVTSPFQIVFIFKVIYYNLYNFDRPIYIIRICLLKLNSNVACIMYVFFGFF